jgi:enoyl-CoA hydratase/carnithine racemase
MSHQFCTVQDEGRLRIVTLNRPEVLNALHADANDELATVWDEFAARDDLWVGIITGTGERGFSAGNDLKVQAGGKRRPNGPRGFAGICSRFDLAKPLIAAVNGVAMGGGFETALACDIIIAAENAIFALPEPRVGLIAGAGGVHRLPRSIPIKKAMGMILTGRRVPAREGFELGFVTEVVPEGQALEAVGGDDPGMFAKSGACLKAGVLSRVGCADARTGHAHNLPYSARKHGEPGLYRRPEGLRGEAQARLAEPLTTG